LPQFMIARRFEYSSAVKGCRQILWGFFKKLVIADNCAVLADQYFNQPQLYSGSSLLLGALFFSFQIYGDFSGYSDIAIGTSRLFGFDLKKNFDFPYFSRDLAEFWRRWHISLTTWFRDYVYIPLGGNRGGTWSKVRNIFIIFIISGFWHGANMTFIVWGAMNALLFLPLLISGRNRQHLQIVSSHTSAPTAREILSMITTFLIVSLLWIFFRAATVGIAFDMLSEIFSLTLFSLPTLVNTSLAISTLLLIIFFIIVEWQGRKNEFAIESIPTLKSQAAKWSFYAIIMVLMGLFMQTGGSPFIYFQF
jgi:alginate O-acetyltransferase complex protein AlgI